ncbi:MAG: amino acid racemase [Candidatus Aminicenantes bacterium]|nr:amino acid racemase [Candidatus Aminicenantes bacterium]
MRKIIGILGGMGPAATVYLFDLIVRLTRADEDGDHIPVIIFNNPQIPDRTAAIINNGPAPLPLLIEGARFLERSGADFIIMPCITAHYFYTEIMKNIRIPFLNLLEETALFIRRELPGLQKLGLLATTGSLQTHIFQDYLDKEDKALVIPDPDHQARVMNAIYGKEGIKAGFIDQPKKVLLDVIARLVGKHGKGCECIIAGCTEIPLALTQEDIAIPLIDPLKIIARRAIREAGCFPETNRKVNFKSTTT